jgi:bacterioferritin-associated ferredoxin
MIVCVCHGLGEHAIRATIAQGHDTRERLAAACGAGTDCGSCARLLDALLDEAQDAGYSAGAASRACLATGGSPFEATSKSSIS